MNRRLYILTGPTAVGKTQLAIEWALANNAEIVSCDSLLFYRGMDIGTAKPTKAEMSQVPHHCIDLVEPSEQFNIGSYVELASEVVAEILRRGKAVLVTGGSGFYLKSFVAPVVDSVVISSEVELTVENLFREQGLSGVVDELKRVAPEDYGLIDLHNARRVIPALKRCLATGKGVRELRKQVEDGDFPFAGFKVKSILLQRSLENLQQRIAIRTGQMLEQGLIEEVKSLMDRGFAGNASASGSIGYREVISYLKEEVDREELEHMINHNTMKLVKKADQVVPTSDAI